MTESLTKINEYLDLLFSVGPIAVYLVVLAACFIENIFPPFPGDTFIVASGGLAAVGRLDIFVSMIVVVAGGLSSVMLIYTFGRKRGRDFFVRKNYKYLSCDDINKMEHSFAKHGAWILIGSRFVVGARSALALVAGIGNYPSKKMLLFSFVSYILFSSLLMYIGFKLVENFEQIAYYFTTYNMIAWPLVIAGILFWVVRKVRENRGETAE